VSVGSYSFGCDSVEVVGSLLAQMKCSTLANANYSYRVFSAMSLETG